VRWSLLFAALSQTRRLAPEECLPFKAAEGGTIFLDEINPASQGFPVKVLRVLPEKPNEAGWGEQLVDYVHRRECYLKAWREAERMDGEDSGVNPDRKVGGCEPPAVGTRGPGGPGTTFRRTRSSSSRPA